MLWRTWKQRMIYLPCNSITPTLVTTIPGVIMLGGLLKSERAIKAHLQFIEYFVGLAHENGLSIFDLMNRDKR